MSVHQVHIDVSPQYVADHSNPLQDVYAFTYTVTVTNTGKTPVQLISRHWIIQDEKGHIDEVKGLGVVGQQPLLRSGEHFEYTSWATLPTPAGTMRGEYFCVTEDAHFFQAPIAEFALVMPRTLH